MIITTQTALDAFCDTLKQHEFITIDTEFLREKTYYPKLCLIQISTPQGEARAIDPLAEELDLEPLFSILKNENVLKVFHAGRQDLEIFFELMGSVVRPVFDTQIAAMVCGYGESVGYSNIVQQVTGKTIDKAAQFTDWSHRPLSERQLDYALGDVTHLIEVYMHLKDKLEDTGRGTWMIAEDEILADPNTYITAPEDAWQRIKIKSPKAKNLAVLQSLAAWREKRAQKKNLPRTWILKDDVLAAVALQLPQTLEQLAKTRAIPKGLIESRHGPKIVELIKETLASDQGTWPKPKKRVSLSSDEKAAIEILRMLLKIKAAEYSVAPKLIADKDDIQDLATGKTDHLMPLKGWRHDVFGKDALALLNGEITLGLKNGQISYFRAKNPTEQGFSTDT